jgi:Fe2+ transport system protein FeoA
LRNEIFSVTNEDEKISKESAMLVTKVFTAEHEVDRKLVSFGVTRDELIEVARNTLASRADAVEIDIRSMAGQLSYQYGTRFLRLLFLSKGWKIDRAENVESVISPDRTIKIVYQNVDVACSVFQSPLAISSKGPAASRMIDGAQGELFSSFDSPQAIDPKTLPASKHTVWYFCMSFDGDNVSVELSLPSKIEGKNFSSTFFERIFLVSGGDWSGVTLIDEAETVEAIPTIVRR